MTQRSVKFRIYLIWFIFEKATNWYMVGNAVTTNRPLNPGELVTSMAPAFISNFFVLALFDNSFHAGDRALQAGHHGA